MPAAGERASAAVKDRARESSQYTTAAHAKPAGCHRPGQPENTAHSSLLSQGKTKKEFFLADHLQDCQRKVISKDLNSMNNSTKKLKGEKKDFSPYLCLQLSAIYPLVRWRLCSGRGDLVQEIVW